MYQRYTEKANRFVRIFRKQHGTAIPLFCASTAIGFAAALALNDPLIRENEKATSTHPMARHFHASLVRVQPLSSDNGFFYTSRQEYACRIDARQGVRQQLAMDDTLQESLASHIRQTYRISPHTAERIVKTAIELSDEYDADPLLLLGIIAKESSFNTRAKSSYGAAGLMQVYAPSHKKLLSDLGVNIQSRKTIEKTLLSQLDLNMTAGTRIYKQYERQYGTVEKALQAYNGARKDTTFKYARKVLALRESFYDHLSARIQTGTTNNMLYAAAVDATFNGSDVLISEVPRIMNRHYADVSQIL